MGQTKVILSENSLYSRVTREIQTQQSTAKVKLLVSTAARLAVQLL